MRLVSAFKVEEDLQRDWREERGEEIQSEVEHSRARQSKADSVRWLMRGRRSRSWNCEYRVEIKNLGSARSHANADGITKFTPPIK